MSDDFEFKPLTEGLGFHKKVLDIKEKEEVGPSQPAAAPTSFHPRAGFHRPASPENKMAKKMDQTAAIGSSPWEPALPKARVEDSPIIQRPTQLIPVPASWPAAVFDATMVLGLVLLFSAVIFAITHIDLASLYEMLQTDGAAQFAAIVLVISVFEIYSVTCRTFFGKTLGEWAFEYRLGSYAQQQQILYPIRVAWRSLLIALTGFIFLPLLSTILRRDVAGILSGTPIFMEKR